MNFAKATKNGNPPAEAGGLPQKLNNQCIPKSRFTITSANGYILDLMGDSSPFIVILFCPLGHNLLGIHSQAKAYIFPPPVFGVVDSITIDNGAEEISIIKSTTPEHDAGA